MLNEIYDLVVMYDPDKPEHKKILDIFSKDFDLVDNITDLELQEIAHNGIFEAHKTGFMQGFKYAINLIEECKK